MNFPSRRKPLARIFLFGCASLMVGGYAVDALAQAPAPLRVDPVLLGLPPIKPVDVPAPVEKSRVDIKPVEASVVEVKTVEAPQERKVEKPSAPAAVATPDVAKPAVRPEAPVRQAQPVVATPVSQEPVRPVVAAPVAPSQPVTRPSAATVVPVTPIAPSAQPVAALPPPRPRTDAETPKASALAPLRVDPALLGLPATSPTPVPAAASATAAAAVPSAATAGGARVAAPGAAASAAAPAKTPSAPRPAASPVPVVAGTPASRPAQAAASTSSMAPLRVDPALLGLPPGTVVVDASVPAAPLSLARKPVDPPLPWYRRIWAPISTAYTEGDLEFYLPLHTHHLRSMYTPEKIASFQETPYGLGVGKGLYNEKGNWEGVYAMAFQDSHFKPMYMAGYGWKSVWRPSEDLRLGLGYTAALMSRADIFGYVPFPVVLPMASVGYKNFSLEGTFVPGGKGNGNIFFIWAKWELGKTGEPVGTPRKPAQPEPTEFASATFGASVPLNRQRVPYGPVLESGAPIVLASPAETRPPLVNTTGPRDEDEVPDPTPALLLRSTRSMEPPPKDSEVPRPTFLSAHRMGGDVNREFNAEGNAELRKIGTVLNSDRLTYWPVEDEVEAEGNVRLEQGLDVVTGPKMRLKLEDQIGYFEQPNYTLSRQPQPGSKAAADKAFAQNFLAQHGSGEAWWNAGFAAPQISKAKDSTKSGRTMTEAHGDADRIDFEGENQVRLTNATYTTCAPGNNDWYAKAADLRLDYDREVGEGTDGTLYFKGVPILHSPWLSFSLNNQRKSGFLAPSFGTSSDSGFMVSAPYYWNIAPNMDVTITPQVMTKRGVMLENEFRYLNTAWGGLYRGQARMEVLPSDKVRDGDKRYGFSLLHTQATANGFGANINYNKVSDDNYNTDLSSSIAKTSQTQLLQQGVFSYSGGGWWNASVKLEQYQTLQPDLENPVREPYKTLPQITINARKPDLYLTDSSFMGQYTHFTRSDQFINGVKKFSGAEGQRTVLYPQVALPYVTPGWYITPKLGANVRSYSGLSGHAEGTPNSINLTLPTFSVDSGMTFERSSNWFGKDYTQTLEPRLYYLNIPYKNQDKIPIFDSAPADFNFAQIFSENQFSGWDRINNANQLTAALISRLLEPNSGAEIMRGMLGQRFYFSPNKVTLTSSTTTAEESKWDRSDVLAAFSGQILPRVYADTAVQYSVNDRQVTRFSAGTRYQPEPGKVLNVAYRYNRPLTAPVDQIDVSAQWPLSGRWYLVSRLNYSLKDRGAALATDTQKGRLIEGLAGLEYNGGCWVVRGVIHRKALTADKTSTAFFIQLELNDFARIGSNPLSLLKRSIQGYELINQPEASPVFGE